MITDVARQKGDLSWLPVLPINMCSHCGECDDPESARGWPEDDDGDRICPSCAETEAAPRLLAACKTAFEAQMHPRSVVAIALLEAIRAVEPHYPAVARVR